MREDRRTLVLETRRIGIRLEILTDQIMAQKGLSAAQGHILLFILSRARDGTSLTEIHQEFGYSMASLSGILKRLRKSGYVRVEPAWRTTGASCCSARNRRWSWSSFWPTPSPPPVTRPIRLSDGELAQLDRLQKK